MSAKVQLVGRPQGLHFEGGTVSFTITTGPPAQNAPKGLPLYGEVTYTVRCTRRQHNQGRAGQDDHSDLVIEDYQEPRLDPDSGRPTIAVVAIPRRGLHSGKSRCILTLTLTKEKNPRRRRGLFVTRPGETYLSGSAFMLP